MSQHTSTITKLKTTYHGSQVVQMNYKKRDGSAYTHDEIRSIGNKMSGLVNAGKNTSRVSTSLKNGEKWFSSRFVNTDEDIPIYESYRGSDAKHRYNDSLGVYTFNLYFINGPDRAGGHGKLNDCFYKCLRSILLEKTPFKHGGQLKKFLGLQRSDKIDIADMPKIENKLANKYRIVVSGDVIYHSNLVDARFSINLKLINGHYTIDKRTTSKISYISFKECKIIMYDSNVAGPNAYDDDHGLYRMTSEKYREMKCSKTHLVVNRDNFKISLEQAYMQYMEEAKILKDNTNGVINMLKCGNDIATSLSVFDHFTKHIENPPDITGHEASYISDATFGALIRATPYKGVLHSYDVTSLYPSIMASDKFMIPITEPEYRYISNDDFNAMEFVKFGLYRCVIECDEKHEHYNLFRTNSKNIYPHTCVSRAIELGLKIKITEDGQINFLYWPRSSCMNGSQIFGDFVHYLFSLKKQKIGGRSKKFLNLLWGVLSKRNKIYHIDCDENFTIPENHSIVKIMPLSSGDVKIDYVENDSVYRSSWARMAPFLLSKARSIISKIMEPHDTIVWCHTDGFLSTKKLDIAIGDYNELGSLRYEGACHDAHVKNKNEVIGDFTI